ncbi:MAG: glycosyltransferase, partial [Patescibacteria group bacterium]
MRKGSVSIFIPVYNFNPEKLVKNIKEVGAFAQAHYREFEIVAVDDSSNRETAAALEKASKIGGVRVLRYENGPSRRENLAASFPQARFGTAVFMDVDLSTELKYLLELTDKIEEGNDLAIGSRYLGIPAVRGWRRLILSKFYNFTIRFLFGSKIHDHGCGFKAFRREAIENLLKELGYDRTGRRGWFWDAELLIRAQRGGYTVIEIPVRWVDDAKSTFSATGELGGILYL